MRSIEWDGQDIIVIDQRALPRRLEHLRLRTTGQLVEAITTLAIRGAPALGIAGAMGVAQAAAAAKPTTSRAALSAAELAGDMLVAARPTAVNLAWAVNRCIVTGRASLRSVDGPGMVDILRAEASAIDHEDRAACDAMARNAEEFFPASARVLTHCNTGMLCTGGAGTALGAIVHAARGGRTLRVLATETRPLLQGARLTAWELEGHGIPVAVCVDGAAPGLIARGEVQLVIVGADRIALNGDVANKVGTYPLALAADAAGIPFVVVAPTSTIDPAAATGEKIPIEERDPAEVTDVLGSLRVTPSGVDAVNPAFDVTPAALISAIVTERGVAHQPVEGGIAGLIGLRRRKAVAAAKRTTARARVSDPPEPARATPKRRSARTSGTSRTARSRRTDAKD